VPAAKPITVRMLLTHTSGIQIYGVDNAFPRREPTDTLASFVPRLASVPLEYQPGSRWAYSNSFGFEVVRRLEAEVCERLATRDHRNRHQHRNPDELSSFHGNSPRANPSPRKMSTPDQPEKRMDLATAIKISLRAFAWGILGFVPLIGLLPGLYVLSCHSRVRREFGKEWNPAAAYLTAGVVLSYLGVVGSFCVVFGIVASITLS
jgi:hypothetical protein